MLEEARIRALWSQLEDSDPIGHPGQGWIAPSAVHEEFLMNGSALNYLICGGDRGAKSTTTAMKAWLLTMEFIAHYPLDAAGQEAWVAAENYDLTSTEMRDCLGEWFTSSLGKDNVEQNSVLNPGSIKITVPSTGGGVFTILTKSVGDPMNSMRAKAPIWILGCEAALLSHDFYLRAIGRLGQMRGQTEELFGQLIMSGCLTGDSLIITDDGIKRIGEFVSEEPHPIDVGVPGLSEPARANLAWANGEKDVIRIEMDKGYHIAGTPNHRVIARLHDGSTDWVRFDELDEGQLVAIRYDTQMFGPKEWDTDDAYFAGLYIAEGNWEADIYEMKELVPSGGQGRPGIERSPWRTRDRITITNIDEEITTFLADRGYRQSGYHWRKTDHELADTFRLMGIDPKWHALEKEVPQGILDASQTCQVAFLQGAFDGDGTAISKGNSESVKYYTSSKALAEQVRVMVLNLGVPVSLTSRRMDSPNPGYVVTILNSPLFAERIGFRLTRKQKVAEQTPPPTFYRNQALAGQRFLGYPVLWVRVKSKEAGREKTYDLHVPGANVFWANGLISHNTLEGSLGWYPTMFSKWKSAAEAKLDNGVSYSFRSHDNPYAWPGGENNKQLIDLERTLPEATFKERYLAVPSPPTDRVHERFDSTVHVREVEYDPSLPIYMGIDPGWSGHPSHYAVVVAQRHKIELHDKRLADQWHIIDSIYEHHMTPEQICAIVMDRDWWGNPDKKGVIDIAGTAHAGSREPNTEVWLKKTGMYLKSQRVLINAGIDRFNTMLEYIPLSREPKVLIDPKNVGLLSELGHCLPPREDTDTGPLEARIYSWQKNRQGDIVGKTPKDEHNDAIKALTYMWVSIIGYADGNVTRKTIKMRNRRNRDRVYA